MKKNTYKSPYERANKSDKEYITEMIRKIEKEVKEKCAEERLRNGTINLTKDLHLRVNKIVNMKKIRHQKKSQEAIMDNVVEPMEIESRYRSFNESTVSEILDQEIEFKLLDLKIDPRPEPRKHLAKTYNWCANYLRKPQRDRVIWPSKLYQFDKKFSQKSLYAQAEQLMDLSAQDFAEWLNSLGSEDKSNINKEVIKELFSIGIEGDSSKALYVEPKLKKSVPFEMARSLNVPELSIEHNVERLLKADEKAKCLKSAKVGFGTALPMKLRTHKAGLDVIPPLQPNFPKDLHTKRSLFKGIIHLKSTKYFVDHLKQHTEIPKPKYLFNKGVFVDTVTEKHSTHVPLYQLFK